MFVTLYNNSISLSFYSHVREAGAGLDDRTDLVLHKLCHFDKLYKGPCYLNKLFLVSLYF